MQQTGENFFDSGELMVRFTTIPAKPDDEEAETPVPIVVKVPAAYDEGVSAYCATFADSTPLTTTCLRLLCSFCCNIGRGNRLFITNHGRAM